MIRIQVIFSSWPLNVIIFDFINIVAGSGILQYEFIRMVFIHIFNHPIHVFVISRSMAVGEIVAEKDEEVVGSVL